MATTRKARKSMDERLKEVYQREEAVEAAAVNLSRRAESLTERAKALAVGADAVMAQAEAALEARAAAAVEKAETVSLRLEEEHRAAANAIAAGRPAFEGAPRPTARESVAMLRLLADFELKERDREERTNAGGTVILIVKDPYSQDAGGTIETVALIGEDGHDTE